MPKQFAVNNPGFHEIRDVLVDAGFQIWLEDKVDILTFLVTILSLGTPQRIGPLSTNGLPAKLSPPPSGQSPSWPNQVQAQG